MRRPTGLIAATSLLVLAGCTTVPEGAKEAQALECEPGTEGCDDILPVGPGGDMDLEMGEYFIDMVGGIPVTGAIDVLAINVGSDYHNVEFLGAADGTFMGGADEEAVAGANGGEQDEGVVELFPGEWTVICNVPGHRAAGMETQVTVYATEEEAEAAEEEAEDGEDLAPQA